MTLPNRRPCVTVGAGPFAITTSWHPLTGEVCEVFVTQRAKSGSELDQHLYELGVAASKAMQLEDL